MDDPPAFDFPDYPNPEHTDMEDIDRFFAESQNHGQTSAQVNHSYLVPNPPTLSAPFSSHIPPTPSSTSPQSSHGQMVYDNVARAYGLHTTMSYEGNETLNVGFEPTGVPLPGRPMQGGPVSEGTAEKVMSLLNERKNLIRENLHHIRGDKEQLLQLHQKFLHDCRELHILFNDYLGYWDKSPVSDGSPLTPQTVQNDTRKEFVCCLCGKTGLVTKGTLKRHLADKHVAPVFYVCPDPTCNKKFPRRDKLPLHMSTHGLASIRGEDLDRRRCRDDGPFWCDLCKTWHNTWNEVWECVQHHSRVTNQFNPSWNGSNRDNNGDGGNYGGGASGPGPRGFFGGHSSGNLNGRPQSSQQGHGGYTSGGYSTYSGHNRHHGVSIENGESPLSDSPGLPTPCSEASGPEGHNELLPSVEKFRPPPSKKMESALTRALHACAPALPHETDLGGLGIFPMDLDHPPRDVDDGPRDKCKSCGHQSKGCDKCRTQKHLGDRCHVCADKTYSHQQPVPLRIELPHSLLSSKGVPSTLPESSPPYSEQDDTSTFDEVQPENLDNEVCSTAFTKDLSGKSKRKTNNDVVEKWNRKARELNSLKAFATKDHGSECSLSLLTRACSDTLVDSWSLTTRTWTVNYGVSSDDSKLAPSGITYRQSTLSLKGGEVTMTAWEVGSLNRSAMLCDPGLRIMLPFLGFYGSGSKADVFTKGQNMIPNIALQGTSFIAKQIQNQHHDAQILRDAASTATKAVSNKRSARLRKKLQVVARVLARYASVANAAPETDKEAIARWNSFDQKSTTDNCEATGVGSDSAGDALLERVGEMISFLNNGMTDMFVSPENTFSDCDDDDDENGMRLVMAFFWQFLIAILRMRNGSLIAREVVACV